MARVVPGESSRLHNPISLGQLELYERGVLSVEKADLGLAVTTMPRTWEQPVGCSRGRSRPSLDRRYGS
jgi:hypothetical protein